MRWFAKFFHFCSTLWFTLKLGGLLASFLTWFTLQRYLLGRVFLVSFCWLCLTLLLVLNQLIAWHVPNVSQPDIDQDLGVTLTQSQQVNWKLVSTPQLEKICFQLSEIAVRFPTHQSLQRNLALCQLAQEEPEVAQNTWQKAQVLQPSNQ